MWQRIQDYCYYIVISCGVVFIVVFVLVMSGRDEPAVNCLYLSHLLSVLYVGNDTNNSTSDLYVDTNNNTSSDTLHLIR